MLMKFLMILGSYYISWKYVTLLFVFKILLLCMSLCVLMSLYACMCACWASLGTTVTDFGSLRNYSRRQLWAPPDGLMNILSASHLSSLPYWVLNFGCMGTFITTSHISWTQGPLLTRKAFCYWTTSPEPLTPFLKYFWQVSFLSPFPSFLSFSFQSGESCWVISAVTILIISSYKGMGFVPCGSVLWRLWGYTGELNESSFRRLSVEFHGEAFQGDLTFQPVWV